MHGKQSGKIRKLKEHNRREDSARDGEKRGLYLVHPKLSINIEDLEWKLVYVGSAEDEKYDQLLESVLVGPVNVGNYRFVFQADPPKPEKIPEEDILGVTVLLLTCSYMGEEFIRVGYYVSNEYIDEQLREEPPPKLLIDKVQRNILADKPRVTKFPVVFSAPCNDVQMINPPPETSPLFTVPSTDGIQPMDAEYSNLVSEVEDSNL